MSALRAGAARTLISPPPGIYTVGYGNRWGGNTGVHDELTATALALDDGAGRIVLVALDLLCLHEQVVDRIRAAVGPEASVVVCCSHTHSGPIGYADERSGRRERGYIDSLVSRIVLAAKQAVRAMRPATLGWSQTEAAIAVNRRERQADGTMVIGEDPEGVVDRSLQVASVFGGDGARIATLVSLACHGTVLGPDNRLVSADWIGAMRAEVERRLGGLGLFLQGAAGNLNPRLASSPVRGASGANPRMGWGREDCWELACAQGQSVAARVAEAIDAGVEPLSVVPLGIARRETRLPFREAARTERPPTTYRRRVLTMGGVPGWLWFISDALLARRYPWRPRIEAWEGRWATTLRVSAVRIGELALVTFGAETFTEIGMAIKAASPARHTVFASVTDGCIGYLATERAHAEGGYEVEVAPYAYRYPGPLAPEGAGRAEAAARDALSELYGAS